MKRLLFIFAAFFILSIPAVKSLLPRGGYTSHDLTHQVVRQVEIDRLLSEGQLPPRWSGDLNNGYGYPLFNFIYPTPALTGYIFHKIGFDYVESVKAVFFVSMIMGVIGMYLFLESLFPKNRLGAFLGSMFYLYAPVRFLDVYVSAAVGNALALGVLPFIFWAIVKASQGNKWSIPIGAISTALLITSHNVTTLMFAPVILLFSVILIVKSKEKPALFKNLAVMAVLGLGLAAFFWIPAIFEKRYIVYDKVLGDFWKNQFPSIVQILHSPWGYGLSHPEAPEPGDISYQVGLAQIFVGLILTFLVFIKRKKKEFITWGVFSLIVFFTGIFMMLKFSYFLWVHLPLLYLVQFPARFMALSVFGAAMGSALIIKYLPYKKAVFVILLIFVLYANRNHINVNEPFNPPINYYTTRLETTTTANEHLPIWGYAPAEVSPGKVQILKGKGEIKILESKSVKVVAQIDLSNDSTLRFNQFYFPGWRLNVDGKPIDYSYQNSGESQGLPVFHLKKGIYIFEANFTNTKDRTVADIISVISLALLGFILLLN